MIRYLIKNNFKLMFRNKWVMAIMIVGPILVIAVLSSAFESLMKSYEGMDECKVGYRIEADMMKDSMDEIKDAAKEAGLFFEEYPEGDIKGLMDNNDLAGFVNIGEDSYTVYESDDYTAEGITLEYFMHKVMKEGTNQMLQQMISTIQTEEIELPVEQIKYMPAVSSKDYYGIVYIVYFIWCGLVCATNVLASEKKNGIERRFQISALSNFQFYLGKWIPIVLTVVVEIVMTIAASIILLDIHWGNMGMSFVLIVLTAMASAAFGLMLYYLCNNLAVTIVVLFTVVWFMGFFGGCFETYMFSSWSDAVKNASPIYHVNRALVEYSCAGESTYTVSSILYMLAISAGCSGIAVLTDKIRKRGRA